MTSRQINPEKKEIKSHMKHCKFRGLFVRRKLPMIIWGVHSERKIPSREVRETEGVELGRRSVSHFELLLVIAVAGLTVSP